MVRSENTFILNNGSGGGAAAPSTAIKTQTTGGWTPFRNIDLGVTGQVIKASAGEMGGYYLYNNVGTVVYVKFYDTASAPDDTFTPVLTIPIPGNAAANLMSNPGIQFLTGIAWRASTGVADNDNTAPAANQVVGNVFFA
jgi:hypothetical protein